MLLTKAEVKELTGKVRYSAQARALRAMGIEHRIRPDGTPAVSRDHVDEVLTGNLAKRKVGGEQQPDWSMV